MVLNIVDKEDKNQRFTRWMTFTMNSQQLGFSQQVMKKKCHSPKDFNSLKEIPSCYAAYAITIESQEKDNRQSKRHPAWTVQVPFHILYGDQLNIW